MAGMESAVSEKITLVNLKMGLSHRLVRKATFSKLRRHVGDSFLADVTVKSADGFEAKFSASLLAAASPVLAEALGGGASSRSCFCSSLLSGEKTPPKENGVGGGSARVQVRGLSDERSLVVLDCSGRTVRALLSLVCLGDAGSFASWADFEEAWRWTRELGMKGPRKLMMCAVCPMSVTPKSREFEDSDELWHHLKVHKKDIIKNFLIPNKKMDNPNAARNCPACRKNVDNREDAIGHSQKCIELIGGQEQWIKGRKNEDSPPTPHSNGAVAHEVSAQSSDDGVESRPSCPDCGKVFKTAFAQKKHKCRKRAEENGAASQTELVASTPPIPEAGSSHLSNVQPASPLQDVAESFGASDEDSAHNAAPSDEGPKSRQLDTETTPNQPIAEPKNDSESTETRSDVLVKESLLTLYLRAMKKKPSQCFFPHCKNKSLDMTHLVVMHLNPKVLDLEVPNGLKTYKCTACCLKFEARNSYLRHLRSEEWKREPPSFLKKYSVDSKEVQPPNLDHLSLVNVKAQGSAKTKSPSKAKETFKCKDCPEEFQTSLLLMHHKSTHSYAQVSDDDDDEVEKKGTEDRIKGKSKLDGFFTCQICGKENPTEVDLTSHMVTHFRVQILQEYPPNVGENNSHTCSINGCNKSLKGRNSRHNYVRHVGTVHKFYKEHHEEAVRMYLEEAKTIVKPSLGTKRKASSPKTATPTPKKRKDDEPVAGTSGNQRRRKHHSGSTTRICQLCPKGFPNVSEFRRHLVLSHFSGDIFKDCPPEYDDNKRFKCTFKGCVFTAPNKNAYVSHRGGVHWEGLLDKYLSEMGKNIDLDGTWPDKEIKMIEYGSRGKAKVNDSNMKKGSPVVSTPKNDTVKKRGRPTSFNSPDVPCSPTTKRKLKDITCDSCNQTFTSKENKRLHTCDSLLDRHFAVDEREKRKATVVKSMRESSTNDDESDQEIGKAKKRHNALVDSSDEEGEDVSESLKLSLETSSESAPSEEELVQDDEDSDDDRNVRKCSVCGAKFSNPGQRAEHIDETGHGKEESKLPF